MFRSIPGTLILLILTLHPLLAAEGESKTAPLRPNVVLFVADDLGMQLGCYGDRVARTPAVDRLAAEGTRYTRACCTTASCSPSRSVILTGRLNHSTGQYGLQHGYHRFESIENLQTLPVLLSEAGYRTCSVGKVHVAPEKTYRFDAYRNEGTQGHRNPVRMAHNAREWITEKDDRPFFLYFCPNDPHRGGKGFANKPEPNGYPGVTPVRFRPDEMVVPDWLPKLPEVQSELAEFYESIARVDQGLAALVKVLEETGHWDNTIVIFTSDNGPPFPGAKTTLYQPGINLPLIVRTPGREDRGVVSDARVSWVDFTPTILDLCGALPQAKPAAVNRVEKNAAPLDPTSRPMLAPFHGRSFRETIGQAHVEGWDELFASHTFHEVTMYYPMRAIIRGKYKYILNIASGLEFPFASDLYRSPTWQAVIEKRPEKYGMRSVHDYLHRARHELYDLEADPGESNNLADDPQYASTLAELQQRLRDRQTQTGDPWVLKWDRE